MKKIGLSIAFTGTSYGMLLQAYATQVIINQMGYDTEIIEYHKGKRHEYVNCPTAYIAFLITRVASLFKTRTIKNIKESETHILNKKLRKEKADTFRKNRLTNIIAVKGMEQLTKQGKNYSAVIVGSDQLWTPLVSFTYERTLRFVPDEITKISYATSLGVDRYPWYTKHQAACFLKRINHLSVREEQGAKIISDICGRTAEVVLDPTYLLTKEDWEELIPNTNDIKERYVLSFILGDNAPMKSLAKAYAKERGFKLVSILSNEVCVDDNTYSDVVLIGKSPEEFINLIRNSEMVFTDSFHGVAFSIINEKQFYVCYRKRNDGTSSRNSRIDNIIKMFHIESRLIRQPEEFMFEDDINYENVNIVLSSKREESMRFLKKALSEI